MIKNYALQICRVHSSVNQKSSIAP